MRIILALRTRLDQLWAACGEYLPTEDVLEIFKEKSGTFTELDLSGLEAVTDEVFHALLSVKAGEAVTRVSCAGCLHVTDLGISFLAQACPKLTEVMLDGCLHLTSASLHYLATHCPELKLISVRCTSVTHLPPSIPASSLSVNVDGCPLLYQPGEERAQDDDLCTTYKLAILAKYDNKFPIADFLLNGNLAESQDVMMANKYMANVELKHIDKFKFNVFESHMQRVMFTPFVTERTPVIFAMEVAKDTILNPWMDIMSILADLRGQVADVPVHVLCLHDGSRGMMAKIEKLAEDTRLCQVRQKHTYEARYIRESYADRKDMQPRSDGDRDFLTQTRFSRGLLHENTVRILRIYALNTNNKELELVYPKVSRNDNSDPQRDPAADNSQSDPADQLESVPHELTQIQTGVSIEDLIAEREELRNQAEKLLNEHMNAFDSVQKSIDSLSKYEVVEVKSFKSPPQLVGMTVGTVALLMGEKSDGWDSAKRLLSKPGFIFDLRQYDKDNIPPKALAKLKKYLDHPDVNREKIHRQSKLAGVLCEWLEQIYDYNQNLGVPLKILKARLTEIEATIAQINEKKGLFGQGSAILQALLNQDLQNLHEKTLPHFRITRSNLMKEVERVLSELKADRVVPFQMVMDKISSGTFSACQKALIHLHKLGKIIFCETVENQPVVTDVDCLMEVLGALALLPKNTSLHNGQRVSFLGDVMPLFTKDVISNQLENISPQQVELIFDLIEEYGIVVPIPKMQMNEPKPGEQFYYCSGNFTGRTGELFLRESTSEGTYSTAQFVETFWKEEDKEKYMWLETNYSFMFGMPLSMMPLIQAECLQMGVPVHIWKWGCIVRHACVEISFKINVTVSLQIKGIDVVLRTNQRNQDGTAHVKLDYVWSIYSHYLLLIDHVAHKFPHLFIKIRQPCRGEWCSSQQAHKFSLTDVAREIDQRLDCPKCMEKGMTPDQIDILTGRQRSLAIHNFVDSRDPRDDFANLGLPFGQCNIISASTNPESALYWKCFVCGMPLDSALRLWEKESSLYPAFASQSFILPATDSDSSTRMKQKGNFLTLNENVQSGEMGVALSSESMLMTGFLGLSITVISTGKISVIIGRIDAEEVYRSMEDFKSVSCIFHLDTGDLETRERDKVEQENFEAINQYDTFSCEVVQEPREGKTDMYLVFKKNGVKFFSSPNNRSRVAIVLECDSSGNKPEVMLHCPTMPVIRAHNFPLGSTLFHKHSVSQQWTLGQVLGTSRGKVKVGDRLIGAATGNKEQLYEAGSENILPITCHMNTATVTIGKEIARKNTEYMTWMEERGSWPTPTGLFKAFHRSAMKQSFNSVGIKNFQFDSWRCMSSRHSPQVLYVQVIKNLAFIKRKVKQWPEMSHLLLPNFSENPRILYNPHVSVAHDTENQSLHTVCAGGKLFGIGPQSNMSDSHFLGEAPKTLKREEAETVSLIFSKRLMYTYLYMTTMQDVFLPFDNSSREELSEFKVSVKKYIGIYLSSFILTNWLKKFYCNPKATPEEENLVTNLINSGKSTNTYPKKEAGLKPLDKVADHLCVHHQELSKSPSKRDRSLQDSEKTLVHFVRSFSAKNTNRLGKGMLEQSLNTYTNLLVLDVQGCKIDQIPGLEACLHLACIDLSRNNFTQVPAEIGNLSRTLRSLDVSENPIKRLPTFITDLCQLVELSASYLVELPDDIGKLTSLCSLRLTRLQVTALPDSFGKLRHLQNLVLDGVPFTHTKKTEKVLLKTNWMSLHGKSNAEITYGLSLVAWEKLFDDYDANSEGIIDLDNIANFKKALSDLFPRFGHKSDGDDPMGGFPSQLLKCQRLRLLSLRYQAFRQVPDAISELRSLAFLYLHDNLHLESLDSETGKLVKLKELAVGYCPNLRTPPPEIVNQGNNTLIAYLRRLSQGSVPCYRTKLMFVGLGGAGKTSLMRALMSMDGRYQSMEGEGITDGIDITAWTLPYQAQTYTFSVWDFAGQTVYYNTHQFFLSKRAVYMLIWNTRLGFEHSGLEFWLSSIACHTPKAPIFVVGTHADKLSKADIPEKKLRKTFPNIIGFFRVSSVTGEGVEDLRSQFLSVAAEQPYMGERIPEAWLTLERLILSERSHEKKLLTWNEVVTLSEKAAITGQEIRRAVLFLHELGTLQYFNNELLRDRVVINPQWIVDVMACVVSVHDTPIKDGRLRHSDVAKIWEGYPKNLHPWLLRLTEVFDLTFPLPDTNANIVPCLLPHDEPPYSWPTIADEVIEMRMFYRFDYLPAGLFNRAQVRLYEFSDNTTMWKEGSVLKKNENTSLVKQTKDNEVMVKVAGIRPENMLLLVHEVIEGLIAEFFQGVKYEYHLPCMDCIRMDAKEPAMFSSRVMNRAIQMKALFLQCHAFFHTLSISEIQGVMPPASNIDFALQLENTIEKLGELQGDLLCEVFFLYCKKDVPDNILDDKFLHPARLKTDLEAAGIKCDYEENLAKKSVTELTMAMRNSKICLVFISNNFVEDVTCQRIFYFLLNNLKTDFILLMVGTGREWQTSDIGGKVVERVFINFQRMPQYSEKVQDLLKQLHVKLNKEEELGGSRPPDVFLSYCWSNSERSVKQRLARHKEGALGSGDPRDIKDFLESNGFKVWLDLEQTGKAGLFEDIAAGMRKSKVVVACVSDEYVLSQNCQMEFRFAHIALHKPIILVVVGTGFLWESTEIGMLSLGYAKVYFQVTNNLAHKMLLQYVQERIEADSSNSDVDERPLSVASNSQKELAFQELYELAQRKFLRQISSYTESSDAYPRLFVVDLSYDPDGDTNGIESEADLNDLELAISDKPSNPHKMVLEDLETGMFCIKTLCEHEGGWHAVTDGVPLEVGGNTLTHLWKIFSPYMARILAILKHSPVNLHIIQHPEGNRLHRILERKASIEPLTDLRPIYTAIRTFVQSKDGTRKRGGLSRCHLPSGKLLWLCGEHQKQSRITVLTEDEEDMPDTAIDRSPEEELLAALGKISTCTTEDTIQDAEVTRKTSASRPKLSATPDKSKAPVKKDDVPDKKAKPKVVSKERPPSTSSVGKKNERNTPISRKGSGTSTPKRQLTLEEKANVAANAAAGNPANTSQACLIL